MTVELSDPSVVPPEFRSGEMLPYDVVSRFVRACGKETKLFRGCRLISPGRISIGNFSQIDEGVWINAGEEVTIGSHVHMAIGSSIIGGGRCMIHDYAGIGAGVRLVTGSEVVDGDGLTNPTVAFEYRRAHRGQIEIGAHAVIFTNSVVLPDVMVGEGAVVAAGSLVHRNLAAWGVYAGNPLVQIGLRPKDKIVQLAAKLSSRSHERE